MALSDLSEPRELLFVGGPRDGEIHAITGNRHRIVVPVQAAPSYVGADPGHHTVQVRFHEVIYVPGFMNLSELTAMDLGIPASMLAHGREYMGRAMVTFCFLALEAYTRPPEPGFEDLYDPDPLKTLVLGHLARLGRWSRGVRELEASL